VADTEARGFDCANERIHRYDAGGSRTD